MIERGIEGLRIGIAPDLHLTPLAPDHEKIFSHVVDTATSIAGTAREVHIPHADVIRPAFTIIHLSESHHVHASELGIYPCENVATPPTQRGVDGCVRAEERVRGRSSPASCVCPKRIERGLPQLRTVNDSVNDLPSPRPSYLAADPC